jgi:hypothetical protein
MVNFDCSDSMYGPILILTIMSNQWTLTPGHSAAGTEDLNNSHSVLLSNAVSSLPLVLTLHVVPQLNIRRKSLDISPSKR